MDLSQYLRFLSEASHLRNSTLECLQHLAQLVPPLIPQFEMVFSWFTAQTTAQFLASLEITRDYGNIPPELRHQTLYLMNELAQNRISLDEFDHQLDLLNDRESAQIEEIFDGFEEVEEDGKEDEEEEEDGKVEEEEEDGKEEEEDGKEEEASGERDNEFDEIKSDESNSEEPEHLRKLFINGLSRQMTDEVVKAHFGQFGTVLEFAWARNPKRNRIRSFGIITYSKGSMVDAAQQASPHTINGRVVSARRDNLAFGKKRIYLAGLGEDVKEKDLKEYFVKYGNVVNLKIMNKRSMQRGCAFVEFDDYDPVEWAVLERHHLIKGQVVEATKSLLKREVSGEREARGGERRNLPIPQVGSSGYNRGGNGGYTRDGGFNGRNSHQSQDWNRQPRGQQQQQQGGRSSDYGNSRYGNRTGGGPIRRQHNRQHSTSGQYGNKSRNHR